MISAHALSTARIAYKWPALQLQPRTVLQALSSRSLSSTSSIMSPARLTTTDDEAVSKPLKPTAILHRTPWRPPIARSAEGSYITLEDGRVLLDAVGGAAVACIGNGHPKVVQAIKEQVDKVSCAYGIVTYGIGLKEAI